MSYNASFIFDRIIIFKTFKYTDQSWTTALGVYLVLIPKDFVGSMLIGWLKI